MRVAYLSPHLSVDSTGGTLVAKSNLQMLSMLADQNIVAYAASRCPMGGVTALDATRNTSGTAWANLHGLCATLSARGRQQFLDHVSALQPDLVWLDTSLFGRLIPEIRRRVSTVRIVSYCHNAEIDLLSQRLRHGALHYLPAWLATFANESYSARDADAVVSITAQDGKRITALYGRTGVDTLPVGLRAMPGTPSPPCVASDVVLFVGSDFGPNVEGLKFLNSHVAPLLTTKRILVVGKGLARHLGNDIHPRLELLGFVDDLADVYASARVTLAPIFSGGGMKVKIAESLMHNRPVLASTFAAIGYEDAQRGAIHVVNTPEEFAQAIEKWMPPPHYQPVEDFNSIYSFDANIIRIKSILNKIGVGC